MEAEAAERFLPVAIDAGLGWFGRLLSRGASSVGKNVGRAAKAVGKNAGKAAKSVGKNLSRAAKVGGGALLLDSLLSGTDSVSQLAAATGGLGLSSLLGGPTRKNTDFDKFYLPTLKFDSTIPDILSKPSNLKSTREETEQAEGVNLLSSDTSLEYITSLLKLINRKVDNHSHEIKTIKLDLLNVEETATASVLVANKINSDQQEIALATHAGIRSVGKEVTKTNTTMTGILKAIKPPSVSDSWSGAAGAMAGVVGAVGSGSSDGSGSAGGGIVGRVGQLTKNIVPTALAVASLPSTLAYEWAGPVRGRATSDDPAIAAGQEFLKRSIVDTQLITSKFFNSTSAGAWIHGGILYISKEIGDLIDEETNSTLGTDWATIGVDWALTALFFKTVVTAFEAGGLYAAEMALKHGGLWGKFAGKLTAQTVKVMSECLKVANRAPWDLSAKLFKSFFHPKRELSKFWRSITNPKNSALGQRIRGALARANEFTASYKKQPLWRRMRDATRRSTPTEGAKDPVAEPKPTQPTPKNAPAEPRPSTSTETTEPATAKQPETTTSRPTETSTDGTERGGSRSRPKEFGPADGGERTSTRRGRGRGRGRGGADAGGGRPPRHRSPRRPGAPSSRPTRAPTPVARPSSVGAGAPPATPTARPTSFSQQMRPGGVVETRSVRGFKSAMRGAAKLAGRAMTALLAASAAIDSLRLGYLSGVRLDLFGDKAYSFGLGGLKNNPTWQERLDNSRTLIERHANPFGHDFFADLFQQMDDAFAGIIKTMYLELQNFFKENKLSQQKIDEITEKLNQNCFKFYQDKYGLKRLNKYWAETGNAPFLPMFRVGADKTVEDNYANRWGSLTKQSKSAVAFGDALINPAVGGAEFLFVNIPGFLARHTFWSDESIDNWEASAQEVTGALTGMSDIQSSLESYYQKFADFLCQYLEKDLLKEFFVQVDPTATNRGIRSPIQRIPEDPNELADILEIQNALAKSGSNPSSITYWPKTREGHRLLQLVKSGSVDASTLETIRSEAQASMDNGSPFHLKEVNDHYTFLALNQRIQPKSNTPATSASPTSSFNENGNQDNVSPTTPRGTPMSPQAARREEIRRANEEETRAALARDSGKIENIEDGMETLLARTTPVPQSHDTPDGGYIVG